MTYKEAIDEIEIIIEEIESEQLDIDLLTEKLKRAKNVITSYSIHYTKLYDNLSIVGNK